MLGTLLSFLFALFALVLVWPIARRYRRAYSGERQWLTDRGRVLRTYRTLRDGRTYDPSRNPELARLGERDWPS